MPKFKVGDHSYGSGNSGIPNGIYDFRIESFERRATGTPKEYLNFKFRVLDHPDHKGRAFFENFSLSERGLWKLDKLLNAAGNEQGIEIDTDNDEFLVQSLTNRTVRLKLITHDSDRGKKQGIASSGFYRPVGDLPNPEGPPVPKGEESSKENSMKSFLEGND